jgi:hypothetical protein
VTAATWALVFVTFALVVVTAVYAVFTRRLVVEQKRTLAQLKLSDDKRSRPTMQIFLERAAKGGALLDLVIANIGGSHAYDVRLTFAPQQLEPAWHRLEKVTAGQLGLFRVPTPVWPMGWTVRIPFIVYKENLDTVKQLGRITVTVDYAGSGSERFVEQFDYPARVCEDLVNVVGDDKA